MVSIVPTSYQGSSFDQWHWETNGYTIHSSLKTEAAKAVTEVQAYWASIGQSHSIIMVSFSQISSGTTQAFAIYDPYTQQV